MPVVGFLFASRKSFGISLSLGSIFSRQLLSSNTQSSSSVSTLDWPQQGGGASNWAVQELSVFVVRLWPNYAHKAAQGAPLPRNSESRAHLSSNSSPDFKVGSQRRFAARNCSRRSRFSSLVRDSLRCSPRSPGITHDVQEAIAVRHQSAALEAPRDTLRGYQWCSVELGPARSNRSSGTVSATQRFCQPGRTFTLPALSSS